MHLGKKTRIMGVLNVTPDSYSDGGLFVKVSLAVKHALRMLSDGADIIDVGGESTRPFARQIPVSEEIKRVLPVVKALVREGITNISIDTRNAKVARACFDEGVSWLNDVSALTHDENMIEQAKRADIVVLMHMLKNPETMQADKIHYNNVVSDIKNFLEERVKFLTENGIQREKIIVDPGVGFGKTVFHNISLIKSLNQFQNLGAGVLCGLSRKTFIGHLTGIKDASLRDYPTMGALTWAIASGADIVRVHNVKAAFELIKVADAFRYSEDLDENIHQAR